MKRAVKSNFDGIITMDMRGTIGWANSTAQDIFQYDAEKLVGRHIDLILPGLNISKRSPESPPGHAEQTYDITGRRKNDTPVSLEVMVNKVSRDQDDLCIISVRDVSERSARSASMEYQVVYDTLTGLPNRILFYDRLHQSILTGRRTNTAFALFIIDLDEFQEINESLGHYKGDWILQEVASRLCSELRESDTVARLGGDEFAVLLPTIQTSEQSRIVAEKLLKAIEQPFDIDEDSVHLKASLGIALFSDHGADAQSLLQHADLAMSTAKRLHSSATVYQPEHERTKPTNLKLKGQLLKSIDRGELLLHYQPKADLVSGRIESVEALVRWLHPEHDLLLPESFIALAEQTGFIRPLSLWVTREALNQCGAWRKAGHNINVAVNLSVHNLQDQELPEQMAELLRVTEAEPSWLELEITETAVMTDPPRALEVLQALDGMGIRLAVDDFGTGYSSLAYLKRLPVDEIKIDKSFVMDVVDDKDDATIVRATIELAHNLGFSVIAEGVVSYQTWFLLKSWGCDKAQGYYISRPLPADQMSRWLEESGTRVDWQHF